MFVCGPLALYAVCDIGLVMRNPALGIFDQVRLKTVGSKLQRLAKILKFCLK